MIPGNHDLKYAEETHSDRWGKFFLFYQDHNNKRLLQQNQPEKYLDPRDPQAFTRIIDQSEEGVIIAEINSCAYVEKGTIDERRGQVDETAVWNLEFRAADQRNRSNKAAQ